MPYFSSEGLYLTHGDDPYHGSARFAPTWHNGELLIDQATWDAWMTGGCGNVGRQTCELTVEHAPAFAAAKWCADTNAGTPPSEGLSAAFVSCRTAAELEAVDYWTRVEARVVELGGCDVICADGTYGWCH